MRRLRSHQLTGNLISMQRIPRRKAQHRNITNVYFFLQYEFTIIGPGYYRGFLMKSHVRLDEPNYYM